MESLSKKERLLIVVFVLASLADLVMTWYGIDHGLVEEMNPFARALMHLGSFYWISGKLLATAWFAGVYFALKRFPGRLFRAMEVFFRLVFYGQFLVDVNNAVWLVYLEVV